MQMNEYWVLANVIVFFLLISTFSWSAWRFFLFLVRCWWLITTILFYGLSGDKDGLKNIGYDAKGLGFHIFNMVGSFASFVLWIVYMANRA